MIVHVHLPRVQRFLELCRQAHTFQMRIEKRTPLSEVPQFLGRLERFMSRPMGRPRSEGGPDLSINWVQRPNNTIITWERYWSHRLLKHGRATRIRTQSYEF